MAKLSKSERRKVTQKRKFLRDNGEMTKKMPRSVRKIVPLEIHGSLVDCG